METCYCQQRKNLVNLKNVFKVNWKWKLELIQLIYGKPTKLIFTQ